MEKIILSVKDITKSYKKNQILKGITFDLCKGDSLALVGVNGCGKSTLFEIICGVKKANSGFVEGVNNPQDFGYMPQTFSQFLDLTVKENLEYLSVLYKLPKSSVEEVLQKCFLKDKQNYLAKNLSGGYKQLLSLAGAIIHKPKLLILDEPTSAMDPLFRDSFWKVINEYIKDGGTLLVTTHYMEEIYLCNKIALMSSGKIVYLEKVADTFKNGKYSSAHELILEKTKDDKYDK